MNKIGYYRQMRLDGAIRTGITVNGYLELESFENESNDPDPVLLWYVDVRCEGKSLPINVEEVRGWLLNQSTLVCQAFNNLADDLQAGLDIDFWPLERKIAGTPRGIRMTIVCSVLRRLEALDIARILRGVANVWEKSILAVEPLKALER